MIPRYRLSGATAAATFAPSLRIASRRALTMLSGTTIVASQPSIFAMRATARPWLPSVAAAKLTGACAWT